MARAMTEATAWRKMAEKLARRSVDGGFICNVFRYDKPALSESNWPSAKMLARVNEHVAMHDSFSGCGGSTLSESGAGYYKRNDARVIFCLLMALESDLDAAERAR